MNERFLKIFRNPVTIPLGVGVISFGTGIAIGFLLGRRKYEVVKTVDPNAHLTPYDLRDPRSSTQRVMDDAEAFLQEHERKERAERGEDIATPAEAFILEHLEGTVVLEQDPNDTRHPIEAVAQSIFAGSTGEWDYDEELKQRTREAPYVLHRDEFYADELGYEQTTMTYYAGDDIMASQDESPVYNYLTVVGPLKFGHGSGDPNVFHVRNDERKEEYEIIHDDGHFSIEVLGLQMETNESDRDAIHPANRKFRPE